MTEEELGAIAARCAAATPGPWEDTITDDGELVVNLNSDGWNKHLYLGDMEVTSGHDHANASFIAHARTDVPELLAEVSRLQTRVEWLQALTPGELSGTVLWGMAQELEKQLGND